MQYFLDCEFNGFGGDLISLALAAEDGRELYLVSGHDSPEPWVEENVIPVLYAVRDQNYTKIPTHEYAPHIRAFLQDDPSPVIVADWPEDISHFCDSLIVAPGQMVRVPDLTFRIVSVEAYPTDLPGALQHNALWDARALRHALLTPSKMRA